ncbi:aldo/keto reductase [Micromonospora inositola]|uniref:Predicted oxidoreductase n=1 Tax=Micromonospora inositola TaxID=47865 RepID=A0A1C5K4U2_9ACTN|nr:aldo/keto reductase [Micromonospora inositola]SCG77539.1 Predicted oxidoreductase [Micromonospora inositola]
MTHTVIEQVRLGGEGPLVGIQGFGAMGIGTSYYGQTDEAEARATLDRALELGITLFDTANAYGGGANEEFLGPFVAANRERVVIATKFGLGSERLPAGHIDNSPAYIRAAIDDSLRRLRIEQVDLYYMHRRDEQIPIEDTVGVMADLVAAGKVAHLGLSEVTADELRAAASVHRIAAVESEWSLFSRDIENRVVPAAAELGVALVPYSPLGRGILTGALAAATTLDADDVRRNLPRFAGNNDDANRRLLDPLRTIATSRQATLAQIALAWLHAQADVFGLPVVPIPGTRSRTRLEENTGATRIHLTPDELDQLDRIADQVVGDRYADMKFASGGRE